MSKRDSSLKTNIMQGTLPEEDQALPGWTTSKQGQDQNGGRSRDHGRLLKEEAEIDYCENFMEKSSTISSAK